MQLFGIKTPLIKKEDDISKILIGSLKKAKLSLIKNDVIVIAESVVATSEGRIVELKTVNPSQKALDLSLKYDIDPRKIELILKESDKVLGGISGVIITISDGVLSPNAGIDSSNIPTGYVVLLPENPMKSACNIRKKLMKEYGCNIGVIIGDSRTQPLRLGCVGIALGCAGIEPVEDVRGIKDLYGNTLLITRRAIADNLVSAAQIIMGEADESTPAVVIRNAPVKYVKKCEEIPKISIEECMFLSLCY